MISLLLILPLILSLILLIFRSYLLNRLIMAGYAFIFLFLSLAYYFKMEWAIIPDGLTKYFQMDDLGSLFLLVMAVVNCAVSIYSMDYLKQKKLSRKWDTVYVIFLLLFLFSMTGVLFSTHLAFLWVFLEATTLTGALLIYFEKEKSSLEAAWKYIFICSIGIAMGFVGIILLSLGSGHQNTLFFTDLYQNALNISPFWLKLSFAFILVGFGTKMGLSPMHAWLPDAHSEAPTPISALLSGNLLNIALLGILRFYKIMLAANQMFYTQILLIIMGFISILVSAAFIIKVDNYKRMLAYSSVENMGIIAIGIGTGGLGLFASMLHLAVHSFAKVSLFLTSGNIYTIYKTKKISNVTRILTVNPLTGWLWIFSFIAISGLPPFPGFISKFRLMQAFVANGQGWLLIPFFCLLVIIVFGMARSIFQMSYGLTDRQQPAKLTFFAYLPQIILLLILLSFGILIPDFMYTLISRAADMLK